MTVGAVLSRLDRGARRIGRGARRVAGRAMARPLFVVALVGVVAVVTTLIWGTGEPVPIVGGESTVRVGVSDGDSVPAYQSTQRAELAQLVAQSPSKPVYALMSFDTYLAPSQVAAITAQGVTASPSASATAGTAVNLASIAAYSRVPLARRQTELVRLPANRIPDDLVAGMTEEAGRKAEQAATYTARAGQDDSTRSLYESFAAVATQEAAAYRVACACVYALVVRATPVALAALADRGGVRVVDAAPEVTDVAYAVFVAPLPEQVDVVRPLPVES